MRYPRTVRAGAAVSSAHPARVVYCISVRYTITVRAGAVVVGGVGVAHPARVTTFGHCGVTFRRGGTHQDGGLPADGVRSDSGVPTNTVPTRDIRPGCCFFHFCDGSVPDADVGVVIYVKGHQNFFLGCGFICNIVFAVVFLEVGHSLCSGRGNGHDRFYVGFDSLEFGHKLFLSGTKVGFRNLEPCHILAFGFGLVTRRSDSVAPVFTHLLFSRCTSGFGAVAKGRRIHTCPVIPHLSRIACAAPVVFSGTRVVVVVGGVRATSTNCMCTTFAVVRVGIRVVVGRAGVHAADNYRDAVPVVRVGILVVVERGRVRAAGHDHSAVALN